MELKRFCSFANYTIISGDTTFWFSSSHCPSNYLSFDIKNSFYASDFMTVWFGPAIRFLAIWLILSNLSCSFCVIQKDFTFLFVPSISFSIFNMTSKRSWTCRWKRRCDDSPTPSLWWRAVGEPSTPPPLHDDTQVHIGWWYLLGNIVQFHWNGAKKWD